MEQPVEIDSNFNFKKDILSQLKERNNEINAFSNLVNQCMIFSYYCFL